MALVVVMAASCGSDDDGSGAGTSPAGESTAGTAPTTGSDDTAAATSAAVGGAPTGSPITLGLLSEETGFAASTFAGGTPVAKAWQQWVNENGGVAGHPVELEIRDTKADPAAALAAANELVGNEDVIALVTNGSTTEGAQSKPIVDSGIAVVGAYGSDPTVWGVHPNYYSMVTSTRNQIPVISMAAKAVGASKLAAVVCAEVAVCQETDPLFKESAPELGIEYVGQLTVAASAPSYTAECLSLIERGADYIQLGVSTAVGLRVQEECARQGYDDWFGAIQITVTATDFEDVPGLRLAGFLPSFPWWADAPPAAEFRDVMEQYGVAPTYRSAAGTSMWAGLELFRAAMEADPAAAADPTRDGVNAAMHALEDEDLDGLLPQAMTYVDGEPSVVNCFYLYKMEDGTFEHLDAGGASGNSVSEGDLKSDCYPAAA